MNPHDIETAASKFRAVVAGCIAGASGFIGWLLTLPPESQVGFLAPLVALCPVSWQPYLGTALKALSAASTAYAVYKASQSGGNNPKLSQSHLDALDAITQNRIKPDPAWTTVDTSHPDFVVRPLDERIASTAAAPSLDNLPDEGTPYFPPPRPNVQFFPPK